MTVYKISLSDKQADKLAEWLARTGGQVDSRVAEEIRSQIPKPVDEPTEFGSLLAAWHPGESPNGEVWSDLQCPEVLRVGVGGSEDEWGRLDAANQDGDAYAKGVEDMRIKILAVLRFQLSSAITAERKDAYEIAIRNVEQVRP